MDAFDSDAIAPSPAAPRGLLDSDTDPCCGLPPDRSLVATATVPFAVAASFLVGLATLVLDRRDMTGAVAWTVALRTVPVGLVARGDAPLGAVMPSRMALISGGMGMWWTRLTVGQSAAPMNLYSPGLGARQQPGHPWF